MGFWIGIILGLFIGANVGVLVAGLFGSCRRQESCTDHVWTQLHIDEAVMEEGVSRKSPAAPHLPSASSDPLPHA